MSDHPHPTDSAIAAHIAGDTEDTALTDHLVSCARCGTIADRLAQDPLDDLPDVPLPDGTPIVPPAAALAAAGAHVVDIAPDQMWRAAAPDGPIQLVWIRRLRTDGRPAVVPVSFDPDYADEYSLIVPADRSPLDVDIVFHTTVETTIDTRALVDCILEHTGVALDIDTVRDARAEGRPVRGLTVGNPIVSLADSRIEYRQHLADALVELGTPRFDPDLSEDNDAHDLPADLPTDSALGTLIDDEITAELTEKLINGLWDAYPAARVLPARLSPGNTGDIATFATIVNIDVFVSIVTIATDLPDEAVPEVSRTVFDTDLSIHAVCFVTTTGSYDARLIDRRSLTENYEAPSGRLLVPDNLLRGPVVDVLLKFFDLRVNPFRSFGTAAVDPITINHRDIAVQFGTGAVRATAERASGLRVPGKADGYSRVADHRDAVIRIVEAALTSDTVDINEILEGEP